VNGLRSKRRGLFLLASVIFYIGSLTSSGAISDQVELFCTSGPTREDNAWQNWIVENTCSQPLTFNYTQRDKIGAPLKGKAVAEPCKRTLILQTFLNSEVVF
jgi:hypothetical protein